LLILILYTEFWNDSLHDKEDQAGRWQKCRQKYESEKKNNQGEIKVLQQKNPNFFRQQSNIQAAKNQHRTGILIWGTFCTLAINNFSCFFCSCGPVNPA